MAKDPLKGYALFALLCACNLMVVCELAESEPAFPTAMAPVCARLWHGTRVSHAILFHLAVLSPLLLPLSLWPALPARAGRRLLLAALLAANSVLFVVILQRLVVPDACWAKPLLALVPLPSPSLFDSLRGLAGSVW